MLDLLIRGGLVVDGLGGPGRLGDVGVRDSRIVAVEGPGGIDEHAARTIDATGLVVAPGFVDIHTHYDAQLSWDPSASPSPLHGVTTVFGGNCGFSLAPAGPDHADYLMRMMARVEGMPLAALQAGLDWSWTSFADWVDRLDGRLGVNAGFLVGHSALRRVVMGDAATSAAATPEQVAAMQDLLHGALAHGAMGFSSSKAPTHNDGAGDPVPSRAADRDELVALASTVGEHPGTTLELILAGSLNRFDDDEVDLMAAMSCAADRPVNWNVLGVSAMDPDGWQHQLRASDTVAARGGRVVALTMPHLMRIRLSFLTGFVLDGLPGWSEVIALPVPERIAALRDPAVRRRLDEGAHSDEAGLLRGLANWSILEVAETFSPANARFQGRRIGDIVAESGGSGESGSDPSDPFDVLLDIVCADDLRTGLRPPAFGDDDASWAERARAWHDDRTIIGASDAGAHLDMMCGAVYSTSLLGDGVRERQLITLEEAVRQLTSVPARLYGLRDRGVIAPGAWADLTLFDPATVGPRPERTRHDLPGGAPRLYADATGIEHVLVNGIDVAHAGNLCDTTPGHLLRSGQDTTTVSPSTP
jgi:N-acyl-D-aspartate/D-glutamate deacylase